LQTTRLDSELYQTRAANGLTVLSESLPGVRSVAVGVWVRSASAHETEGQMGVSHMLEHMVFKGTTRRSARDLALELEVRGGSLDAFTSRDHTCYQAHVLDSDLPIAIDILSDLVHHPLLRQEDLAVERNVVLEEINGVLDTPDDLVYDRHVKMMWPRHPYGYSILGSPETVGALTSEDLRRVHRAGYYPGNCVITAAGSLEHQALLAEVEKQGWLAAGAATEPLAPAVSEPAVRGLVRHEERDTTQSHVVLGSDVFAYSDPRRYALSMLTNALGGGMSSRLFQKVREELGLAYAVYAFQQLYRSAGLFGVYVGTKPETAGQAVEAIFEELARVADQGLPDAEVADARQQLKGQLMLSLESPGSRMGRLAAFALHGDRYRPLDEILALIDSVGAADIAGLAAEYLVPERQTVLTLGPAT